MNYLISFFIFSLVLFLYLHIYYQLKTSNDLEVFTIKNPSKDKLEEICNIRQPVIFDFNSEEILDTCNIGFIDDTYNAFDIKIRDVNNKDTNSELYIPLLFSEAIKERSSKEHKNETTFIGINSAEIKNHNQKEDLLEVSVSFISEIITCIKDKEDKIISGDPQKIKRVNDTWKFSRNIKSQNPNWQLIETEV